MIICSWVAGGGEEVESNKFCPLIIVVMAARKQVNCTIQECRDIGPAGVQHQEYYKILLQLI